MVWGLMILPTFLLRLEKIKYNLGIIFKNLISSIIQILQKFSSEQNAAFPA